MKNNIRFSAILLALVFIFSSCGIKFVDDNLLSSPTATTIGKSNVISIKKHNSDTKYINIYRQDVTGSTGGNIENIGIVYPLEKEVTFIFQDDLILKDHSYRYYARIYDGVDYYKTDWSNTVKNEDAGITYVTESDLPGYASGSPWTYTKEDYKLTYTLASDSDFPLAIVMECGNKTQIFQLSQVNSGTNETVSLVGLLSPDYYDKPVKVLGICGQKITSENGKKHYVHWTKLTPITISGEGITDGTTFSISSSTAGDVEDYSRQLNKNWENVILGQWIH